jgi:hypothetical protein
VALSILQKLEKFRQDSKLQAAFEEVARHAWLPVLLWPERRPRAFPAKFRARDPRTKRDTVYPLIDVSRRLDYVAMNLEQLARTMSSHPSVAFLYLSLFEEEYRPARRKAGVRSSAAESGASGAAAREEERRLIHNRVQRLKRKLVVSPAVRRARNRHDLSVAVLAEFDRQTEQFYAQRQQKQSLEIELEMHRKTLGLHAEDRKRIDELVAENANLNVRLSRERERSAGVEQELGRLADQVLHGGPFTAESQLATEYQQLRHEHAVLSQKYDALVSKNIELSNRLERAGKTRALEEVLNTMRDKINGVLRSGLLHNDNALLASLQGEISQLQRARIYLGRALYDVGMLYLRSGDRKRALAELRAARELGVESADTNRILGSIS